jgi:hypothetical protein
MAALPVGGFPSPHRPALRLVAGGDEAAVRDEVPARPGPRLRPTGRRRGRLLPGLLTLGLLGGLWWGAGALSGLRAPDLPGHRVAGATLVAGQTYVVRPGDTLWSIALRLDPAGDPRPLVDQLAAQSGGGSLQPGEVLHLP